MRQVLAAAGLVTALTLAAAVTGETAQAAPVYGDATAYGITTLHDGRASGTGLTGLTRRWSRDLGGPVSYPLVVGNRIYVTVAHTVGYGTDLYALDAATGATVWGPVDLGGVYFFGGLTYDAGRVFTLNHDGVMGSYDAVTGARHWSLPLPGQWSFTSPPTAYQGTVYTGGAGNGGTLYAVDEVTGAVRWTGPVANGDSSSPAVGPSGVHVSYACEQTYRFGFDGTLRWHHETGCSGGGGRTPVLHGGRTWVRDDAGATPAILDSGTGQQVGTFAATPLPAFAGSRGLFLSAGRLSAVDLTTFLPAWTATGDGGLVTAPVSSGRTVYVGSSTGRVFGWNIDTGRQVFRGNALAPISGPDEHNAVTPAAMAIGGGRLVVPAGTRLTVFAGA